MKQKTTQKTTKPAKKADTAKANGAIIRLADVWKIYRMGAVEVTALRGLDLEVRRGEFLSIMGPSGSGKSTAMNMIGCLDIPSKGAIYLDGQDISHLTESELAQIRGRKIGFIFQKFNIINTLTALENVMLPMTFQNIEPAERRRRAIDLLRIVDLDDRMDHKPTELSGGQQQRVAIARALAVDPEVILADEPTGNLDSTTGTIVMEFLKKLHKEKGTTIVLVTHDANVAKNAQRVEVLKDGQIVKQRGAT
ncbi:MAG: ABC transporter ATP-binding protein [Nanoarchaeota archaeon]